jgi:hypothetical protein
MKKDAPSPRQALSQAVAAITIVWLAAACSRPAITPAAVTTIESAPVAAPTEAPTPADGAEGLSADEQATLNSLEKVDDYPLYTMRYFAPYDEATTIGGDGWVTAAEALHVSVTATQPTWACSLFAAMGDAGSMIYGRNFDWEFSPAVLLFTDPPDGYASVSMVDMAYLGFDEDTAGAVTDRPLAERGALLEAPFWPFDGMNERGLAVGMAAVPPGQPPPDPNKGMIGSLVVIREMLDHAGTVDEAAAILQSYNVYKEGGPDIHYLVADPSGRAILIEFYGGETVIIPNETPWHLATNFLRASASEPGEAGCWRYDRIGRRLAEAQGRLAVQEALNLLSEVSVADTEWSVAYQMSTLAVSVVMGRQYSSPHTFHLHLTGQ